MRAWLNRCAKVKMVNGAAAKATRCSLKVFYRLRAQAGTDATFLLILDTGSWYIRIISIGPARGFFSGFLRLCREIRTWNMPRSMVRLWRSIAMAGVQKGNRKSGHRPGYWRLGYENYRDGWCAGQSGSLSSYRTGQHFDRVGVAPLLAPTDFRTLLADKVFDVEWIRDELASQQALRLLFLSAKTGSLSGGMINTYTPSVISLKTSSWSSKSSRGSLCTATRQTNPSKPWSISSQQLSILMWIQTSSDKIIWTTASFIQVLP